MFVVFLPFLARDFSIDISSEESPYSMSGPSAELITSWAWFFLWVAYRPKIPNRSGTLKFEFDAEYFSRGGSSPS
jgi:hypothetical protein